MSASVSSRELFEVRIDDRVAARLDHAELGDRDLEVGQELEQHRLELLVGLVDLVDQQHDGLLGRDRGEQRPLEQELLAEDVLLDGLPAGVLRLGLDAQELLAVVPLVQRLGLVEALVALEPDQPPLGGAGERLRELGLADAGRALDEHRLAELRREVGDERRGLVREVPHFAEARLDLLDALELCRHRLKDTSGVLPAFLALLAQFLDPEPGSGADRRLVGRARDVHGAGPARLRDRDPRPHLQGRRRWSRPGS